LKSGAAYLEIYKCINDSELASVTIRHLHTETSRNAQ